MGKKYWLGVLLIWLFGLVPVAGATPILSTEVIKAVNTLRSNKGRSVLVWNKQLSSSAQAKADDMAKNIYFSHVSPKGVGVADLLVKNGYSYLRAGENMAYGYENANEIVAEWSRNTEHRSNMLGDYIDTGVGVSRGYYDGKEVIFVVQHFGSPSDINISVKPDQTKLADPALDVNVSSSMPPVEEKSEMAKTEESIEDTSNVMLAEEQPSSQTGSRMGKTVNWLGVLLIVFSIMGAGFIIRSLRIR